MSVLVELVDKIKNLEQELVETRNLLHNSAVQCDECRKEGLFPWHYVNSYTEKIEEREFDININDITSGSLVRKNVDAEKLLVKVRTCPNGHETFVLVNQFGEEGQTFKDGEKPEFNII